MTIKNDHNDWVDLLPEYAAGRLGAFERARVEAHLASCARCRDELEGWHAVAAILRAGEDSDTTADRGVEAGWNRLVALLPAREGASASGNVSRARAESRSPRLQRTRTIEIGTFEETPASNASDALVVSTRPLRRAARVRDKLRLVLAVAAVMAIVGSFAALGVHHVPGISRAGQPVGQWVQTSTPPAPTGLPRGALINDLTMVSANEGWAVGSIIALDHATGQYTFKQGLILHYQNGRWDVSPESPRDVQMLHFWTPAPGELWAWGRQPGTLDTIFLHYQDGHWRQVAPPVPLPTRPDGAQFFMTEIRARTSNDVWMVGMFAKFIVDPTSDRPGIAVTDDGSLAVPILPGSNDSSVGLMLWHYDGSRWTAVANLRWITDVAPAGPNEAWALAQDAHSGRSVAALPAIAHVHGTNATIAVPPSGGEIVTGLMVNSSSNVWAAGETSEAAPNTSANHHATPLYHYDGIRWTQVRLPAPADIFQTTVTGHDDVWGFARSMRRDPTFGPLPRVTQAFTYQDGRWQQVHWAIQELRGVSNLAVTPAGDMWAIGTYDIIWSRQNADNSVDDRDAIGSVLLHYVNGIWTQYGAASK